VYITSGRNRISGYMEIRETSPPLEFWVLQKTVFESLCTEV